MPRGQLSSSLQSLRPSDSLYIHLQLDVGSRETNSQHRLRENSRLALRSGRYASRVDNAQLAIRSIGGAAANTMRGQVITDCPRAI